LPVRALLRHRPDDLRRPGKLRLGPTTAPG
jgi:hypothetical protein